MLLSVLLFHIADSGFRENSGLVGAIRQIVLETRRAESLRACAERIARSRSAKCYIIEQLFTGRLSFRQAAIQFQKANELVENADFPSYLTPADPHGVSRQVLFWVRNSVVSLPPEKAQRLISDFECEYRKLFGGAKPDGSSRGAADG
jgi:hypothetical protein